MKRYIIVNVTHEAWTPHHSQLHPHDRPKYIHFDRDEAEKELLRLAKEYQGDDFILFESVATAVPQASGTGVIEIQCV